MIPVDVMSGALLRSGSLRELEPLGAVGSPVYSAATQLRAAIRRQIGDDAADLFAIPKPHEDGDTIDWYAPRPGDVVPWSAATPDQRATAKATLLAARDQLADRSRVLQADERSERQVFGRLLARATDIPSEDYIYLVDGRPVLTFWGFHPADAPAGLDVISGLQPGSPSLAAPPPIVSPPVVPEPPAAVVTGRRSWWWLWLLLLLLLLALLLLALRHCRSSVPGIGPLAFPPGNELAEATPTPTPTVPGPGGVVLGPDGSTQVNPPGGQWRDITPGAALPTVTGNVPETGPTSAPPENQHLTPPIPEHTPPASGTAATQPSPPITPPGTPPRLPQTPSRPDVPTPPKNAPPTPPKPPDTGQRPPTPPRPPGTPLTIPKEAVQAGSTAFLNGQWRSITGLQDRKGNPVELSYDFNKGQGTVSLRRSVGGQEQTCTGRVGSTLKDGRLEIDQRSVRCPDGTNFQDSAVQCTVGTDNKAVCTGQNSDGTRYDVNIVK